MAEYDAFGRRKGENPLEQIGSAPEPPPAPMAAGPAAPAGPPPASSAKPVLVAIVAAMVVAMACIGIAVALLAATGEDGDVPVAVDDAPVAPQTTQPAGVPPAADEAPAAPDTPEARGLDEGSLLTQPSLERALRALRVAELGQPVNFRLAADRIDAALINGKGDLRMVQVGPDAKPRVLATTKAGQPPAMQWSAIDPAAPQRLVRAAAEREKRSAGDVDYLVLLDLGEPTWGLFFKGGTHYQGDATGKITRRVTP